jgi:CheY-like chemotaxis protein
MLLIRLIHCDAQQGMERAEEIQRWGHKVVYNAAEPLVYRDIRQQKPDLVLIDLSRLPSHGREVGNWLIQTRSTRSIPFIFVEGAAEKRERVKKDIELARFANYETLNAAIQDVVLSHPREFVSVARRSKTHQPAGYSSTPLCKKLGLQPNATVHLLNAPPHFKSLLIDLPQNIKFKTQRRGRLSQVIWFVKDRYKLESLASKLADALDCQGYVWICWPKQSSGVTTDVTQAEVRRCGLKAGLIDYKTCAIDSTWSALKFSHRR